MDARAARMMVALGFARLRIPEAHRPPAFVALHRWLALTLSLTRYATRAGVARDRQFDLRIGQAAELVCWGVMPSGMLRDPLFAEWLSDPATLPG